MIDLDPMIRQNERIKICVVTGGRSDYGPLRPVLEKLKHSTKLDLSVVAAGMHLCKEFGSTVDNIIADGFPVDDRVEVIPVGDSFTDMAEASGMGTARFARCFERLKPVAVMVLGDRFEIFAAASAATLMRIPVVHLCGGDVTEGAIDDVLRHAVTKMAHLHFPSNTQSADRILQMGEAPDRIEIVGSPGIDAIMNFDFLDRTEIEARLEFALRARNYLVTFHSVTLQSDHGLQDLKTLLAVLEDFGEDTGLIFSMPNMDAGGQQLSAMVQQFVSERENRVFKANLGQALYLSTLRAVDAVVGNSSSGLSEAPSLGTATVNVGRRQANRLRGCSVIDCPADSARIRAAFVDVEKLGSTVFENPYGDGKSAPRIVAALEAVPNFPMLLRKSFYEASLI